MSTKTSIKRIALVAVSALGLGVVTSVAPASAAPLANTEVTAVAIDTIATARVGAPSIGKYAFTTTLATNADDVAVFRATLEKPATSTASVVFTAAGLDAVDNTAGDATKVSSSIVAANTAGTNDLLPTKNTLSPASGKKIAASTAGSAKSYAGSVGFIPDVAGTYVITVWHDTDLDGVIDSAEARDTETIVAGGAPTAATLTVYNSTAHISGNDTPGSLIKVTLTDAAGAVARLSSTEAIRVTATNSGQIETINGSVDIEAATYDLVAGDFDSKGRAWINVTKAAAGTSVVSFAGVGSSISTILSTTTITYADAAGVLDAAITIGNLTGVKSATAHVAETTTANDSNDTNGAWDTNVLVGTAVTFKSSASAASAKVLVKVTDTNGLITGLTGAVYQTYVSASDGTGDANAYDVSYTAPSFGAGTTVVGNAYSVQLGLLNDVVATTARAAQDTTVTTDQTTSVRVKNGGSVTLSVVVKDQFLVAMPNVAVVASVVAGSRNAHVTALNTVSDANGRVSFTYTDAPLTGVTATTDTVRFKATNVANYDHTVSFTATLGVSKVVVTSPNTTAGVANSTVTVTDIVAGATGAQATTTAVTAKVTDASGSVLVGVPVTFTISGTGAAVLSTKATAYTDATGIATSAVYGWTAGAYTVTATAETVTGTGAISFGQTTATEARTIAATTAGSIVTATVRDRFGNGVKGATVYATKTGAGYFGNGLSSTSGATDANGNVEFNLAGGAVTVTVSLVNPADPAGTTYGQSAAAKGYDIDATNGTALTAYVAGTALVAEKGVGSSYDAAGVSSASVEVNAIGSSDSVDAANEATDAANAATDAANAAAEAADAATAAAQDAQAAVAELATKVASLIAGIKAQITTLTNLVIKIQKKVRA